MLNFNKFSVTVELSSIAGNDVSEVIEQAKLMRADVFNIPDGILGRLTIDPIVLAARVREETGKPVIAHLTCRDSTKLGLASRLLGATNLKVDGVLALTGDAGTKNIFEIRAPGFCKLIRDLNTGSYDSKELKSPTNLAIGVAVNPNVEGQIDYLAQKIAFGAQFVQTQPIFDLEIAEKFFDNLKSAEIKIPVLFGVMPLKSVKVAEYFNEKVVGITVPQKTIDRLRDDKNAGVQISIELLEKLKDRLAGVHVMPLGVVDAANKIYDFLKNRDTSKK